MAKKKKTDELDKEKDNCFDNNDEHCDCGCDCDCDCEQEFDGPVDDEDCGGCCGDCASCGDCGGDKLNSADLASLYLNMAKQVQADFDNYKKRNEKSKDEARESGKIGVIVELLPCIDAIDKAVMLTKDDNTKKGLQMVQEKFVEVLKNIGVQKYESVGLPFDANEHCAVCSLDSDKQKGTVIEEVQAGYKFGDKIIRFAQVVVAK